MASLSTDGGFAVDAICTAAAWLEKYCKAPWDKALSAVALHELILASAIIARWRSQTVRTNAGESAEASEEAPTERTTV